MAIDSKYFEDQAQHVGHVPHSSEGFRRAGSLHEMHAWVVGGWQMVVGLGVLLVLCGLCGGDAHAGYADVLISQGN